MKRLALMAVVSLALAACGPEDPNYGKSEGLTMAQARIALKSSAAESVLRIGNALTLESIDFSEKLQPNTKYSVQVAHLGQALFQGALLTNMEAKFETSTLSHDVGEFGDGFKDGDKVEVKLDDGTTTIKGTIQIEGRVFQGPGWTVDEVSTPHVYSAGPDGQPTNAFVVGGQADGEVKGPIYVAGDHFPADSTVDVYVVKDRDEWKNRAFPKPGEPDYIAGPISVQIDAEGKMPLTSTGFAPSASDHLGPYDIIVDTDRNGTFDWSLTVKDAADGENKVGFTVQYSQAYLQQMTSKHLVVNLAYDNKSRNAGNYRNSYTAGMVYGYVNPPVFNSRPDYHTRGIYVMIEHQSWEKFWNNPDPKLDMGCPGCRDLSPFTVQTGGGGGDFGVPLQPGCMNGPPVALLNAKANATNNAGQPVKGFDLIFLANRKDSSSLVYIPGRDLLDLNMVDGTSGLVNPTTINDTTAKGFKVE